MKQAFLHFIYKLMDDIAFAKPHRRLFKSRYKSGQIDLSDLSPRLRRLYGNQEEIKQYMLNYIERFGPVSGGRINDTIIESRPTHSSSDYEEACESDDLKEYFLNLRLQLMKDGFLKLDPHTKEWSTAAQSRVHNQSNNYRYTQKRMARGR